MSSFSFLSALTFIRLRVKFEALEPIELTDYPGSAFRSCLMEALMGSVCAKRQKKICLDHCELRYSCPWSVLFNSYSYPERTNFKKTPPPYILEALNGDQKVFKKAEALGFDFTLIGAGIKYLAIVQLAFQQMGDIGIGKGRAKFKFAGLEALHADLEYKAIAGYEQPDLISLSNLKIPDIEQQLKIKFQIEFRTLVDKKFIESEIPFQLFLKRLTKRLSLLAYFHCNTAWTNIEEIHFPENVAIVGLSTRNEHYERKTSTMESRMMLDGPVGEITYSGDGLHDWMPLIAMGSWLHVGSTTSMGLGKYAIVEE